jgi:hypothetical protein
MPQARISATVLDDIVEENISDGECRNIGLSCSSASVMAFAMVAGIGS